MSRKEKELMRKRDRSAAIILRDGKILMEKVFYFGREFYVLPGGGVEPGETPEETVLRELKEECGVDGEIIRPLSIQYTVAGGTEYSFEVRIPEDQTPVLGYDPEEPADRQALKEVCWMKLNEINEKDRAFLWGYGLLNAGNGIFFDEIVHWGTEISYPEMKE